MTAHVTKAQICRAMAAAADQGAPVKALRICPNGDVLLLTELPEGALPPPDASFDWVAHAGETDLPRA